MPFLPSRSRLSQLPPPPPSTTIDPLPVLHTRRKVPPPPLTLQPEHTGSRPAAGRAGERDARELSIQPSRSPSRVMFAEEAEVATSVQGGRGEVLKSFFAWKKPRTSSTTSTSSLPGSSSSSSSSSQTPRAPFLSKRTSTTSLRSASTPQPLLQPRKSIMKRSESGRYMIDREHANHREQVDLGLEVLGDEGGDDATMWAMGGAKGELQTTRRQSLMRREEGVRGRASLDDLNTARVSTASGSAAQRGSTHNPTQSAIPPRPLKHKTSNASLRSLPARPLARSISPTYIPYPVNGPQSAPSSDAQRVIEKKTSIETLMSGGGIGRFPLPPTGTRGLISFIDTPTPAPARPVSPRAPPGPPVLHIDIPTHEDTQPPKRPYAGRMSSRPSPPVGMSGSPRFSRYDGASSGSGSPAWRGSALGMGGIGFGVAGGMGEGFSVDFDRKFESASSTGGSTYATSPENYTSEEMVGPSTPNQEPMIPRTPPTAHITTSTSFGSSFCAQPPSPFRPTNDRSGRQRERERDFAGGMSPTLGYVEELGGGGGEMAKPEPAHIHGPQARRISALYTRRGSGGGMSESSSGSSIISLATFTAGLMAQAESSDQRDERERRDEAEKEREGIPVFNVIPATPIVNGDGFEGRRESKDSVVGDGGKKVEKRVLEDALELKEGKGGSEMMVEVEVESETEQEEEDGDEGIAGMRQNGSMEDLVSTPTSGNFRFSESTKQDATAIRGESTDNFPTHQSKDSVSSQATSTSFPSMTSMSSMSASSSMSSIPDVEEALGSMLRSLSGGTCGSDESDPMQAEKQQVDDELASWASLGLYRSEREETDRARTPTMADEGIAGEAVGLGLGLGLGLGFEMTRSTTPPLQPLGSGALNRRNIPRALTFSREDDARTPIVNHKVAFYSGAKPRSSSPTGGFLHSEPSTEPEQQTDIDFELNQDTPIPNAHPNSSRFVSTYDSGPTVVLHSRQRSVASTTTSSPVMSSSGSVGEFADSDTESGMSDMDDLGSASIASIRSKALGSMIFASPRTVDLASQFTDAERVEGGPVQIGWAL